MYYLYILYSPSKDKFYVGISDDVERRLAQHNAGSSNYYTKSGIPWEMKAVFACTDRSEAMKLENRFKKSKSKKLIQWVVESGELPPKWGFNAQLV